MIDINFKDRKLDVDSCTANQLLYDDGGGISTILGSVTHYLNKEKSIQFNFCFNYIGYIEFDGCNIIYDYIKHKDGTVIKGEDDRSFIAKIFDTFKPVYDVFVLKDIEGRVVMQFKSNMTWIKHKYTAHFDGSLTEEMLDSDGYSHKIVRSKTDDIVYYENSTGYVEFFGKRKII